MHNSHIVLLINDDARAVTGRYEEGGKLETFKTMDPSVRKDDLVVVESGTRHGMTVVKVEEVNVDFDFDTQTPIKWIVQRIDKAGFDHLLAQEADAISEVQAAERKRKKAELRKSLMAHHENQIQALELHNVEDSEVTE